MEMVTHAIGWFEIPAADFDRAKKFYSAIFDYEMPEVAMAPNRMGFLLSEREHTSVGGAIVSGPGYVPAQSGTLVYLSGGKDLSVVLSRIEKAGGAVLVPKTQVSPESGYYAHFTDSEGNRIGLHSMA